MELEPTSKTGPKNVRVECPHCQHPTKTIRTEPRSPVLREIFYRCTNEMACGFYFSATLEVVRTIKQSRSPNPLVAEMNPRLAVEIPNVQKHISEIRQEKLAWAQDHI